MKTLKYGVIGLGFFGEKHVEVLSTIPGVEVTAVCTRRPERLAEIAGAYGVPKVFRDYNELLADTGIDAVSIVTHAMDHVAPTIAALRAGKHVFLEKPMALTVRECDEIIPEISRTDKKFMVGHICRFDPAYAQAKQAIDNGAVGKIVSIYARRNIPARVSASVLEKISPVSGDIIHDTDIMLWLTGDAVRSVYAQTVNVRNLPHPDIGWAMYRFAGGAVGVAESVWFLPDKTPYQLDARMEIIGDKGAVYITSPGRNLEVHGPDGVTYPETIYWPKIHDGRGGALKEELTYFVRCILAGKKPDVITPEESRAAVAVVEAAEESAVSGRVCEI